jgi:Relaxase/Mobilisation nuclease domain
VIIEGKSRGKGKGKSDLAVHLMKDENERIRIMDARGTLSHDLSETLSDWQTIGWSIGCKKPLYHANVDPDGTQRITDAQKREAVDRLEAALGFQGQPRIVIEHEKKGREHLHVVWLRIDTDRMRVLSDSFNYYKHERVATELEREFGLPLTQRALTREEGLQRPRAAPSKAELQQAQRSGLSPHEARRRITEIWNSTETGQQFAAGLESAGWMLARGDRRDFVALDPHGNAHSLTRRVEGHRTADIRDRLSDIDPRTLPSVAESRDLQKARQRALDEPGRLRRELSTEDAIARAGIIYAKQSRDIDGKRQRRAASDDGDGDMVSEQGAALERFAKNSADLQARCNLAHLQSAQGFPTTERTADGRYETTPEERAAVEQSQARQSQGRSRSR